MTALKTLSIKLNTQKLEQEKKAKQLAEREQDLKFGEEDLRIEQGDIPNKIKAGIEKAAGAIQTKLTQAEKDKEHYRRRLVECEDQLEKYRQQEREADGMTMTELLEKLASRDADIQRLTKQLNARPDEVLHAEYKVKAQK